jgi:hypothetical protein
VATIAAHADRAQRHAGCHPHRKIFVFGGEKFGGVFNNAEMFDPETERWTELTPMPIGRHGTGAVRLGNMIFVPAGGRSMEVRPRQTPIKPSFIRDDQSA